eukprot:3445735-Pleurochrysis_carterae.AAC.2
MSPPPWAKRALSATSESTDDSVFESTLARVARESFLRAPGLDAFLSPRAFRFGQSLCQCWLLHQRQGAHLVLHCSFGSGLGRFGSTGLGSIGLRREASSRTANAWAESACDSSSRLTFRTSTSLSTLRAALKVRARSPTPAFRANFTSSRVEMLSLSRRTAFAIFSDSTVSGS